MNQYQEYCRLQKNKLLNSLLVWTIIVALTVWAYMDNSLNISMLINGIGNIAQFIYVDMMPPDFSQAPLYIKPVFETLYMSFIALLLSVAISMILGILAAKNTTPHTAIALISRGIISFIRAVPSMVAGLFFVATFGIGVFAGIIALGVAGIGILGKAYADSIEEIESGQLEAIRSSGASWFQMLGQGVWPQLKPSFISWTFYKFDTNIRDAAVIGLIGAGGIGYYLNGSIKLFQYKEAAFGIFLIFLLIIIVEYMTSRLRKRAL
ncbi:phosphonate ABC transporter, permease protein PhnE [Evansella halocellulosilytica]|uniref:phosphonate ABC transporter, permease protein PhnE n=1 Tax=Evansella halocellulosilytica TaxID=2011013 RepID=UPI0015C873BD|nr:phosphonate ABC transporter, permease protein PhnE [Evansella halocellulosilytica]